MISFSVGRGMGPETLAGPPRRIDDFCCALVDEIVLIGFELDADSCVCHFYLLSMYRAVIAALDIGLYTLPCVFIIKIYGGAHFAPARSARVGKTGCSVMPSLLRELPGLATGNLSQGNVRELKSACRVEIIPAQA